MSRLFRKAPTSLRHFATTRAAAIESGTTWSSSLAQQTPDDKARAVLQDPEVQALFAQGANPQPSTSILFQTSAAPTVAAPSPSVSPALNAPLPKLEPVEDPLLHQFSRLIMKDGKLLTAQKHLQLCLDTIRSATNNDALPLLRKAVRLASPELRTVQQKITATKRATLPLPISEKQSTRTGINWIVQASYKRRASEKQFGRRLALEMLAVLDGTSEVIKKKEDLHRTAMLARCVFIFIFGS